MIEDLETIEATSLNLRIKGLLDADEPRRESQALAEVQSLAEAREQSLRNLESRLDGGMFVLVINYRPSERTSDDKPAIDNLLFGILDGRFLLPGPREDHADIIHLPTQAHFHASAISVTGRNSETIMEENFLHESGLLPLVHVSDRRMRFPEHMQKVLLGVLEMEDWFANHPQDSEPFLSLYRMFHAATDGKVLPIVDESLLKIRDREIQRLLRLESMFGRDGQSDEILDKINVRLMALGVRKSVLPIPVGDRE